MKLRDLLSFRRRKAPDFGKTIHSDADYRLTHRPGDPARAVFTFCGVGLNVGGVQIEEFRSSLGAGASCYYFADLKRSWWNDGRIEDFIDLAIDHARRRDAGVRFAALGNSMGGSGAILAAHLRPEIERCLAFVPQADVRPSSPETRWRNYRSRIARHRWETFALASPAASHRIVFGRAGDEHAVTAFAGAGFAVTVVDGADHRVASCLRDRDPARYGEFMRFAALE